MPWFITAIATERDSIENPSLELKTKRTFGFYNTYNEAYKAVKENRSNMHECLYDFIVMEYIETGIHPTVFATEWWIWTRVDGYDKEEWVLLPEDQLPSEFNGITNWALG